MLLCFLLFVSSLASLDQWTRPKNSHKCTGECARKAGKPLFIHDYLKLNPNQRLKDREDFKVEGIGNFTSYAGFAMVRETTGNHQFWWYFPAQNGDPDAPLVLWLQGGPGGASTFGLFAEMGPLELTTPFGPPVAREYHWNKEYGMIFIDNPVGAGFSFTTSDEGYATNTKFDVARDLYECLQQFYGLFPELVKNEFYVTGESYGGHYVPAIGAKIHNENSKNGDQIKINLQGVAIGDGWIDPVNQVLGYADLVYNFGFASIKEKQVVQEYVDNIHKAIIDGRNLDAFNIWDEMLNGDIYPYANYFHNITGSNDYDNMLNIDAPKSFEYYATYLSLASVRKALHVGNATLQSGRECEMHLREDVMRSFKTELALLMENYKVLLYSGQLDVIIGAALTELFLPTIAWSGQNAWMESDKILWKVDGEVAGYVNTFRNFSYAIVRDGGHILPADQPKWTLDMVNRFIKGIPFDQ